MTSLGSVVIPFLLVSFTLFVLFSSYTLARGHACRPVSPIYKVLDIYIPHVPTYVGRSTCVGKW